MSHQDSHLRSLLSPSRSGTFFAPFRSRSANPDGFDSKMKLWICAIEEWAVANKRLIFSLKDIHQIFVSDSGIHPDKECIRLVLSEMRRRSRAIPLSTLRTSKLWSESTSQPMIDSFIDPQGWIGWGVRKFVYNPATWAVSALTSSENESYSDLTDMSITDSMKFVCQKSLHELSQVLLTELLRISKAEKQACFEWQHLLELITPIMNTIIDTTDGKELLGMLDILIEYLAKNKRVSLQLDNDSRLIKIISTEDTHNEDVSITKKDIAMARLLRAKELLTADADKYHAQAQKAREDAQASYSRKEVAKAKSLLRSHKRLLACAEQKETQLTNVEIMLEQLENTNSNMMILEAYKDGAEALKIANTKLDNNTTILDEMYDATAEAYQLNDDMTQMLNDISRIQGMQDITTTDLEDELNQYIAADNETVASKKNAEGPAKESQQRVKETTANQQHEASVHDLEEQLNRLVVCQDPIIHSLSSNEPQLESTPKKATLSAGTK